MFLFYVLVCMLQCIVCHSLMHIVVERDMLKPPCHHHGTQLRSQIPPLFLIVRSVV
jgi:hypothetical protein